jgi:hypothetical protein
MTEETKIPQKRVALVCSNSICKVHSAARVNSAAYMRPPIVTNGLGIP